MLSPVGHDLCLEIHEYEFEVSEDGGIAGWVDPVSIHVLGAWNGTGVDSISKGDVKKIEKKMLKEVFSRRQRLAIEGDETSITVSVGGKTDECPISVDGPKRTTAVSMSALGLAQVTAFFGALKVSDRIEVEFESELLA